MHYLISVIDDDTTPSASAHGSAAPGAFNDRLKAEGNLVFVGGLEAPGTATVIDNRDGKGSFTEGPFLESREHLGGLWIIEAPDLDAALKLAAVASRVFIRKVEVRQFHVSSA